MADTDPLAEIGKQSDEDLKSLESDLVAQFDAADEADDLDAMSAAADQIDSVRAEIERRGAGKEETVTASAADNQPESTDDKVVEDETKTPEGEQQPPEEGKAPEAEPEGGTKAPEAPAEDNTPSTIVAEEPSSGDGAASEATAADPASEATASGSDEPEATTAGGDNKEDTVADIPEKRQPVVASSSNEILAGTDIPGFAAGMPFTERLDVAKAFERRLDTVARARGGDDTQHTVATIVASAPPERTLDPNDLEGNLRKIEAVTAKEAITASGGYCAPLETRYDIFGTGTTARPVRDALAGYQARRGGIRYTAAPKITDFAGASGVWTAANDANPTSPTTKPCLTVVCQPEVTAVVDAVTLCLKFGNLMARAFPELIDRNNQLALVAHARFAERNLLSKLTALSTSVTSAFKLGTTLDFLHAIGRGAAAYRHRYRMDPGTQLRVLAPIWVRDAMREDLAWRSPGDDQIAVADATIDMYLRSRNVNVSWHLDAPGFPDEVAASALDDFPTTFDWYLFAEGSFIFLDGGTLDLGIVRDSTLVGTNDYKTFTESFEGVARIGAESIKVTTTTNVAGAYAEALKTAGQA